MQCAPSESHNSALHTLRKIVRNEVREETWSKQMTHPFAFRVSLRSIKESRLRQLVAALLTQCFWGLLTITGYFFSDKA